MGIVKIAFQGNPNIGLYAFATDEYCLIGQEVPLDDQKQIEKVLKVPVHPISIGGTSLIGIFVNGNEKALLLPSITFDHEKSVLERLGIPFMVIPTRLTAIGNNTIIGKHAALVSDEYSAVDKKTIRQALGLKVVPGTISGVGTVGSLAFATQKGILASPEATAKEVAELKKHLRLPVEKGTINMKNPYIHSGIIANKHGCAIGAHSSGVEINDALQALGFL